MHAVERSVESLSAQGIQSIRRVRAPRELVFDAWTKIEHLSKWWGPRGFSMTVKVFEPRQGGRWQFMFHGPDGREYELSFVELERPSRVVIRHENDPKFTTTATFEDEGDYTAIVFSSRLDSVEEWERVKSYAIPGHRQTLDRMEERVATLRGISCGRCGPIATIS